MRGFRTRQAFDSDVPAIAQLVASCSGEPADPSRVAAELAREGVRSLLVHSADGSADGRLAGWAWVDRRCTVDVHPLFRGRGIGAALLEWVTARALTPKLTQTVDDADVAAVALLRSRGWEPYVTQWQLGFVMDSEPEVPALPEGVLVRGFEAGDAVAAYEVTEDAFGEWQQRRRPYAEWARMTVEHAEFAPGSSPVAMAGDHMVGVVISHGGLIETVAVHRDHRGRGIARALLRWAFRGAYRDGHPVCRLWTHSQTGALSLYERVGMSVTRSSTVFSRGVGGLG